MTSCDLHRAAAPVGGYHPTRRPAGRPAGYPAGRSAGRYLAGSRYDCFPRSVDPAAGRRSGRHPAAGSTDCDSIRPDADCPWRCLYVWINEQPS